TAHGITAHHRKSFCRISDLLLELQHQSALEDMEQSALDDVGVPDEDHLHDELVGDTIAVDDLEQELDRRL
ncbi:MAG TPA: hypothetical protein VM166_10520, partial [Gemmatimonadaceae bacterium]|nr:hypothetical protein [Gemmatimonadaceae bacterium]